VPLEAWSACFYALIVLAFAVVTWRRPAYAVAGLILLEPFAFYRYIGDTTITLPKAALAGLVIGLLVRRPSLAVLRDRRVWLVALACLAVVVFTALSFVQADFKAPVVREALKAAEYFALFVACAIAFASDADEAVVRNACFAIAAVVSLLAIAQEFTGAPSALWVGHHAVARIAGPLEGPNQLSGYLGMLLAVTVAFLVLDRAPRWAWAIVVLAAAAEFLTFSRAGVAAGFIGVGVALIAARLRSRAGWAAAVLVPVGIGIAAVALVGGEVSRFWSTSSQLQPEGLGTRQQLWQAALTLWRAHPILGIGAGNYELELGRAGFPELHTHANGQFLQALVEGGIPLLAALVWATVQPIVALARAGAREPFVVGTLGALSGLALHQLVDDMTFFPKVGMLAWILTALALASIARRATATVVHA